MSSLVIYLLLLLIKQSPSSCYSQSHHASHNYNHDCKAVVQFLTSVNVNWLPNDTDCCSWSPSMVTCDSAGHVIRLDLSSQDIGGALASNSTLFSLRNLQILDLHENNFAGTIPAASLGNLTALTVLNLHGNNFSGSLDFENFANLRNLRELYLPENINLLMSDNGNCSFPRMRTLDLSGDYLTKFPYFLRSMEKLELLDLSDNMIPGDIPLSICQVSSLQVISLSRNKLNGTIPRCLGNLTKLSGLDFSRNQIHGSLPPSLANCTQLRRLDVGYNRINDTFPHWLSAATKLYILNLQSNKFHGLILPSTAFQSSSFLELKISDNEFSGMWPTKLFLNSTCLIFDVSNNKFEGPLPITADWGQTTFYSVSNNKFTGEIPSSICSGSFLEVINLSANYLTGFIPQCFERIMEAPIYGLEVLNLRANRFHGQIPDIFVPRNQLMTIDFSQNQFSGTLPRSIGRCQSLQVLDLSGNMIEDVFPGWLATLPALKVVVLKSNRFHGHINSYSSSNNVTRQPFSQLLVFDISNNFFCGRLPVEINFKAMMNAENNSGYLQAGQLQLPSYPYNDSITLIVKGSPRYLVKILKAFVIIDLSSNFFQGEIPQVIGNLKALNGLNLSHNNITGTIPSSTGNLTNLEWLDLSSNKLNGEIPRTMVDITSLEVLNLSKNQLTGQIPQGKQFNTFKSDAFDGNPGLCGVPLPKSCADHVTRPSSPPPLASPGEEDMDDDGSWIEWRAVLMSYGCGIVFGISVSYIILETARPIWVVKMVEREQMRIMNWFKSRKTTHARRRQGQS